MPSPRGNLFTLALETVSRGVRSAWGSDGDRLGVAPFPPDFHEDTNYTQVVVSAEALNNTVSMHTVTTGKTFYMNAWALTVYNSGAVGAYGRLIVTNSSDVTQYSISSPDINGQNYGVGFGFPIPLKIPAGYKIKVTSNGAQLLANAFIHGFEK